MQFTALAIIPCLGLVVASNPTQQQQQQQQQQQHHPHPFDTKRAAPATSNSTTAMGLGTKLQATVTGYAACLTQKMACGLTGAPGTDPTAAMSAYLIPGYAQGVCGTCWKFSNPRALTYHGSGQVPTIGGALQGSRAEGMVVLVNNACAPGKDQAEAPGAVGQCNQSTAQPKDRLGSDTVMDLCRDTTAVRTMFGSASPGLAVADVERVDCALWSGHVTKN